MSARSVLVIAASVILASAGYRPGIRRAEAGGLETGGGPTRLHAGRPT